MVVFAVKMCSNAFLLTKVMSTRHYSSKTHGILSNITVLDMTRVVAGPFCSMLLGDLGANVIKVESLDGDEARKWGPPFMKSSKDSYYFLAVNRNKKSVCVDLKSKHGKSVIYDLVKKSDIMVENFLPGKLDKMEVGYEKLSQLMPSLIYCAITGFGPTGPYANKPGYDVIAAAMGGLINATGEQNGNPVKVGVAITDLTTGLHAFGAILAALYHRQQTGLGQKIDCNLFSTQISSMINLATIYLNTGIEPKRWGTAHANLVPYEAFKTQDGYIVIGAGSDAQFKALCTLIDKNDLASDNRFKSNSDRVTNREILIKEINKATQTKPTKEWTQTFKTAPFPNGPINTMKDVFEDEHVKEIGLVKELTQPDESVIKLVGPPTVYSLGGNEVRSTPPTLGEHTTIVLKDLLGYSDEKIQDLFKLNVIR